MPVIQEFKKHLGDGIWRVNWASHIGQNANVPSENIVTVSLSLHDAANSNLAQSDKTVVIGVGQLINVHAGSYWQNGKLLPTKDGTLSKIQTYIDTDNVRIERTSSKILDQTLIPYNDYRTFGVGKGAWCLCIRKGDDPAGIIIPAIEIIRFYYATSSLLSKSMFNGDIVHNINNLVNPEYCGMVEDRCVVHRRKNTKDTDCWVIGRVQNSEEAFEGVRLIHDSLLIANQNQEPLHPKSQFPFTGETILTAYTKEIGYLHKRTLVLSLVNCAGAFPYESLEVLADNSGDQANPDTDKPDDDKKPTWGSKPSSSKPQGDIKIHSEEEPDASESRLNIESFGERFSDIAGKKIIKTLKDECQYISGQLHIKVQSLQNNQFGTGDGTYGETETSPVEIFSQNKEESHNLPASLLLFDNIVNELNILPGISARLYVFKDQIGTAKAKLTKARSLRQWGYIDHRRKIIRNFMIANIYKSGRNYLLVDIECRPNTTDSYKMHIFYRPDYSTILQGEIDSLVSILSKNEGRALRIKNYPCSLERIENGMSHIYESSSDYAVEITRRITHFEEISH